MRKKTLLASLLSLGLLVSCGVGESASSEAAASSGAGSSAPTSSAAASSSAQASSSAASSEAPHEHVWTAGTKTGLVTPETCTCGDVAYRLDIADATGWNDPATKMNGKTAPSNQSEWDVTGVLPAGDYSIGIIGLMSYASHGDRCWYNMWETDTASTPDTQDQDPFRYFFKVNGGEAINPDVTATWTELGYEGQDGSGAFQFGMAVTSYTLAEGATTFDLLHGNIGYSLIIQSIRLIQLEEEVHEHVWTPGTKVGDVTPISCTCGKTGYEMNVLDADGYTDSTAGKLRATPATWDITGGIAAGNYEVYVAAKGATYLETAGWSDTAGDNTSARYYLVINNDGVQIGLEAGDLLYGQTGLDPTETEFWFTNISLARIALPEGATSLQIGFRASRYSIYIDGIRLVKTNAEIPTSSEAAPI